MKKFFLQAKKIFANASLRKKILWTLFFLAVYRLLVVIPVPFVSPEWLDSLMAQQETAAEWFAFFAMLLGWSLENFSLIAVWLAPFINASIIIQLLTAVVPHFEELQEMWEQWQKQIQQYTRYATFPLAFLQSIWMVYFINSLVWGAIPLIDTTSLASVIAAAFTLSVWSMIVLWLGDLITEKGIANGVSLLIFASIIAGITQQITFSLTTTTNLLLLVAFVVFIVLLLIVASLYLIRSRREIPVVYARQWKVEQTSFLPIPLNPVGMIPIIFAIAFTTFPYLVAQLILKVWTPNPWILNIAERVDLNLNIYTQNPSWYAIVMYFILIVAFTFFYTLITFNPDRIADTIQKKWWFIPGIRPWAETARHIYRILMHLALWWGIGLALLWVYNYVLVELPFARDMVSILWDIPVVVQGSWVIIIVWVVQELINKVETELMMQQYDSVW